MKTNKKNTLRTSAKTGNYAADPIVEFKITRPEAHTVSVVGTFNNWDPKRNPLRLSGGGLWRVFLPLNPGRYEYRFVVDGQWQEDPTAEEFAPNPFGGRNTVLNVVTVPHHAEPAAVPA